MSGSATIEGEDDLPEGPEARRQRRDTSAARRGSDAVLIESAGDDLPPEDALADARAALEASEQRAAAAREQARRAQAEVQQANAGRFNDRTQAVAAALEAAKSDKDRASQALRTARETGDIDAEIAASDEFTGATYRMHQASAELTQMQAATPRAAPAQPNGPGPEARKWIAAHPRFNSDAVYQSVAVGAHNEALQSGIPAETPAYFNHIERTLTAHYGEDHGTPGSQGQMRMEEPVRRSGPASSSAAPSSRGDPRGGGGSGTVRTLLGPVGVTRRSDGRMGIQIPQHLRETFEEGARISGMPLAEYAREQVLIAREREAGGTGDLIETETQTWR